MRGNVDLDCFAEEIAQINDRSDAAAVFDVLPRALHAAGAATRAAFDCDGSGCLHVIGWDDARQRPFGAMLTNDERWFGGAVNAGAWVMVSNARGHGEVALCELMGRDIVDEELSDPARFDLDRDSLTLIEAQRRRPWGAWPIADPSYAIAHRIGGWVDQAEVTSAGVTERRIIHWPEDCVGERIAA
ncbi:hypothetical protein [Sphingomonas sp. ID0503]|uniref:hypothetical protein n=1 Tax=Sphingomonas sp. ID0503 TaxID=3399691 RepID=UPI003AFAE604